MPNSFIPFPRNMSRRIDTDREPIEPVPEEYVGDNNPYRGIENHGVAPTESPSPVPGYSSEIEVEYLEEEQEPTPVPVRIVQTGPQYRRTFRTIGFQYDYAAFGGRPFMLLPREPYRTKAIITQTNGFFEFYVGHSDQLKGWNGGFPVSSRAQLTIESNEEVWGLIEDPTATNVRVGVLCEYEIPLREP